MNARHVADRTVLMQYHVIQRRLALRAEERILYSIPPKLTKACNSSKVQSDNETHSPSNMKTGAFPVWVSSLLVFPLIGCALLLVLVQFLVPVLSLHRVAPLGFSAFAVVSGGSSGALNLLF